MILIKWKEVQDGDIFIFWNKYWQILYEKSWVELATRDILSLVIPSSEQYLTISWGYRLEHS